MNNKNAWLLTILAGAAGGVIPTFTHIALESMNPATFTLLRYIIAGFSLLLITPLVKDAISWRNVVRTLPISVLAAINAINFPVSIQYLSPASVQLIYTVVPLLVVIFSWFILRQKTSFSKIVGVIVGLMGVAIVALTPLITDDASLVFSPFGTSLVILGASSFALYTVFSKKAQAYASTSDVLMGTVVATLLAQVLFMIFTATPVSVGNITLKALGASIIVGAVGTTIVYWLYQYIIKISTPLLASVVQYVMPVFGAFWAFIILGNTLPLLALMGGLLAIAGAGQVNGVWKQLYLLFIKVK